MKKLLMLLSILLISGLFISAVKATSSETQTPPPANSYYIIKVVEASSLSKTGSGEANQPSQQVAYNLSIDQAKAMISAATGTSISNAQAIFSDNSSKRSFSVNTNAKGIAQTAKPVTGFQVTVRKVGYEKTSFSMTTNPSTYSVAIIRLKKS